MNMTKVRTELQRHGITQRELGRKLNMSHASVNRRLRGATPFRVDELERVAEVLEVTVAELLVDEDGTS